MKKIYTILLILFLCPWVFADEQKPNLMVIQSYSPLLKWTEESSRGISDTLKNSCNLSFIYLDSKRSSKSDLSIKIKDTLQRFKQHKPHLVILGDDTALQMLGPQIANQNTPVVYMGINNNPRAYFKNRTQNITGVLERTPVFPAARILKKIQPKTSKILFMFDSSPTTQSILKNSFKQNQTIKIGDIYLKYKIANSWREWKTDILEANEFDFIVIVTFHAIKDLNGNHIKVANVVEWTSANSNIPVLSCQGYTVGDKGTFGAYTLSGYSQGTKAAQMASKILSGTPPSSIPPITDHDGILILNPQQLTRNRLIVPRSLANDVIYKQ